MSGANRKVGDLELEYLLEEVERVAAPRIVLDLRSVEDPDDIKTSEVFSLGPGLQRTLRERSSDREVRVLYRFGTDDVAETFSAQFDQLKRRAPRGEGPTQALPLLGVAEVGGRARVLGPLPKFLRPVFDLLAERGELTATDLTENLGTPPATASDYLGELDRLRIADRVRETLSGGGTRYRYLLTL